MAGVGERKADGVGGGGYSQRTGSCGRSNVPFRKWEMGRLVGIVFGNHVKPSGVADSGFGNMPTKGKGGGGHVFAL